ncbi:MAG TPA: STAS domain-containing protein [Spirochaetota bacterium]|nr:STAS domain-containing protein [Spirochaetota bacterium]
MTDLHAEQYGDTIIIHLNGVFNIDSISLVERIWTEQVVKMPRLIAINCLMLESLDSSAIGSIVKFFNYAMGKGIMMVFYDLNSQIRRLFETAKFTRYFNITTVSEFKNRYFLEPQQPCCEMVSSL